MAVYKGLDVLTAKPSDVMQAQVKYYGLDIADCDQNLSIIDYLNYLIDHDIPEKSFKEDILAVVCYGSVSSTHLPLPTIYSV